MMMNQTKRRSNRGGKLVLLVVILAAAAAVIWLNMDGEEAASVTGSTYTVTRGDLLISVVEGGNLKAQKSVNIECEVEGSSTVVFLIPEGTYVKEGDLLVELDSSDLEERFTQQEIQYNSADASYVQAQEELKIQESQNKSDIMAGDLAVEFAKKELEKYLKEDGGSRHLDMSKLQNDITIAQAQLARAKDRKDWTEQLALKGFVTKDELEADKLTLKQREIELVEAEDQLKLAKEFDFPMNEARLRADVAEAELGLERIKRRADSQIALKVANENSKKAQFELQEERFNKLKEQLEKCRIMAPQGGLVVYGSQEDGGRWGRRESDIIEEGADVRYRQTLITLPDVSVMIADTKVHESAVDKVVVGLRANISLSAFPDEQYGGWVSKVAILPDSQSRWLNPDLKQYATDVTLEDGSDKLKPGMSAMVEIIIDTLKDVIYVPLQSVYRRGGREVCYVSASDGSIEIRPVAVGMNNDQFVEIVKGLDVGEQVLLYAPAIGDDVEEETAPEKAADPSKKPDRKEMKTDGDEKKKEQRGGPGGMGGPTMAAPSEGGRPDRGSMSPEMMKEFQKLKDLSPEDRKKAIEKLRADGKMPDFGGRGGGDRRKRRSEEKGVE